MTVTRIRSLTTALCALALTLPALSGAQTKDFSETVPLDSGGRLRVEGSKGSITLTAWDRNEVEIGMTVEAVFKAKGEREGSILDIEYFRPR